MGQLFSSTPHFIPEHYQGVDHVRKNVYPAATDLTRWSLEVKDGRQVWRYLNENDKENKENPIASRYHVGLDTSEGTPALSTPVTVEDALFNAVSFFEKLQTQDGHWAGDYGGPMFLLPGYAIVNYLTKNPVPSSHKLEMIRYLSNMQNEDGGWGLHIECASTVMGTSLNYVAMRIFGVPRDDSRMVLARQWLEKRSGCLGIPQWGKFWLCTMNIFQWEGMNSLLPEMALLPRWFPLHPCRMWSYCRTVYMPMSYVYGLKFQADASDPLIQSLREELIFQPYESVDWTKHRNHVAKEDLYTPHTWILDIAFKMFNMYEAVAPKFIRKWALDWTYTVGVTKEDENTNYIDIGPVNKMMNMLSVFLTKGKDSDEFRKHVYRLDDYLWMGKDGMKMNGTNGSQLWDTSFMVQGLIESRVVREETRFNDVFNKAHNFLDVAQVRVNHPDHAKYFRDETKGGWPFSTRDMGWIVADCTGEGLKGALICKGHQYTDTPLDDDRIFDAVNILLLMQNSTGGYATCEKTRGSKLFEWFNASEVFGDIMIDYDYVECTSSALTSLSLFRKMYPSHRTFEVDKAVDAARKYMLKIQRPDGSWEGMWGICFTYGIWFAVDGLVEAGETYSSSTGACRRGCEFLISKQKEDGGWGETFMSCVTREYVQHPRSQVIQTAWAVLALLRADYPDQAAIRKGVKLLLSRQLDNGDWAPESLAGVFNKNCMIDYSNFKNIFPIWAIARYVEKFPNERMDLVLLNDRKILPLIV
eukprot:CFRG3456T1